MDRTGIITFDGGPATLSGNPVKAGDAAPGFRLLDNDLNPVSLVDFTGKTLVCSVVPSLDTGVCDLQTRRFNSEAAALGDQVRVLTVSCDLPFAQARWCGLAGADRLQTLSDHYDLSFGLAYGVVIKEFRLLARSIFIVNAQGTITYMEIVPEVVNEVNYEAAIAAAKAIV